MTSLIDCQTAKTSKCYEEVFQELSHSLNETIKFYLRIFTPNEFDKVIKRSRESFFFPEHGTFAYELAGFTLVKKEFMIVFQDEILPYEDITIPLASLSTTQLIQLLKSLEIAL